MYTILCQGQDTLTNLLFLKWGHSYTVLTELRHTQKAHHLLIPLLQMTYSKTYLCVHTPYEGSVHKGTYSM